ncbi:hypothetical protein ACF059_31680 [Streptomyces sp. NPDC016562]|uniref:hypothetical protein n=1 Tax=Streptomyces sp. NPDC016562 TaxID=3364966 RepID=UPI0036F5CDA5
MEPLTSETWTDALKLYEWVCTFVGVAAREHDEWWLDAGAIMRLETQDPRGWESIDPYDGEEERREDPLFPWLDTPSTSADAERCRALVSELPRASVPSLLILLAVRPLSALSLLPGGEGCGSERDSRAEVLLSRFPEGTRFYTNLGWKDGRSDVRRPSALGSNPFSGYDWDAGLIAVNEDEVAVFWNFQNL